MKKPYQVILTWVILTLTFMTILTACGDASVREVDNDGSARFKGIDGDIKIITDSETGCKYIFVEDGMGQSRTEALSPLVLNNSQFDCQ